MWSPYTVRAIPGHGLPIVKMPVTPFFFNGPPVAVSIITGSMPKNGNDALPGFIGVTPGKPVIK